MNQSDISRAIKTCIAAIGAEQLPDGGFLHVSSSEVDNFNGGVKYKTTFCAANILACLGAVNTVHDVDDIRAAAARFLLAQKSEYWSFNYWARDSREAKDMPYPDDLDDTFVALAALHGYNSALIDGGALAGIAKILTALEVTPGGPYRTWLVGSGAPPEWRDVDLAVNANIAHFLLLGGISLPNFSRFIEDRIQDGNLYSPYYPNTIQPIYFISRFYRGEERLALAEALFHGHGAADLWQKNLPQNPLETAMIVSALINLSFIDEISSMMIESLVATFHNPELLRPYPFCIDPSRDGKICYASSLALTAAFCAEALAKYAACKYGEKRAGSSMPMHIISPAPPSSPEILLAKIKEAARARCSSLPDPLKKLVLSAIENVKNAEIAMVPYAMHVAIGETTDIQACLLDELALANLYGWMAYSIYDDFFDDEVGEKDRAVGPQALSVANYYLRELTLRYAALDGEIPGLRDEFIKIMNTIDVANVREQEHCRTAMTGATGAWESNILFNPDALADRSMGHALPALAVLMAAGYAPDSPEAQVLTSFFKHYLAARQLHDDAHDWKEDFQRGRINSVGARLLALRREENGSEYEINDLLNAIPGLQKIFWHEIIPGVIADILKFLHNARSAIRENGAVFKNTAPLFAPLDRLEVAAKRTLHERDEAIKFMEAYCG